MGSKQQLETAKHSVMGYIVLTAVTTEQFLTAPVLTSEYNTRVILYGTKQQTKMRKWTTIIRRIFFLLNLLRERVMGCLKVLSTIEKQNMFSNSGITKPTISINITIFDKNFFQVSLEKFSKQVSVLLPIKLVVFKKVAGTLPASTVTHTAMHTMIAFLLVLSILDLKGWTIARKRSALMQVKKRILPYMFVRNRVPETLHSKSPKGQCRFE